jgi:hypothetical protein
MCTLCSVGSLLFTRSACPTRTPTTRGTYAQFTWSSTTGPLPPEGAGTTDGSFT